MSQIFFLTSWTGLNFNKWLNFDSIFYRLFLLGFFGLKKTSQLYFRAVARFGSQFSG